VYWVIVQRFSSFARATSKFRFTTP